MTIPLRRLVACLCLAGLGFADSPFVPSEPIPGLPLLLDHDGDGRLDLMNREPDAFVFRRNQGGRVFQQSDRIPVSGSSGVLWKSDAGDFDNDNLPDAVWTQSDGNSGGSVRLATGAGVEVGSPLLWRLPGAWTAADSLVTGIPTAPRRSAGIWRVDPDGVAGLHSLEPRLRPFWRGDLDGDGRPEILGDRDGTLLALAGNPDDGAPFVLSMTNRNEAPARFSTVADLDGDGRPEILRVGAAEWILLTPEPGTGFVYRRIGVPRPTTSGPSFNSPSAGIPPVVSDLDGDGSPDVVVRDRLWLAPGLSPSGSIRWLDPDSETPSGIVSAADLDGDGRPELVGVFQTQGLWYTRVYWNRFPTAGIRPEVPSEPSAMVSGSEVRLGWNPGDGRCPSFRTFNLRVGTAPGKSDVVSALSGPSGDRRVSGAGNAGSVGRAVLRLPPGTYHWAVQAIGPGGVGGAFCDGPAFRVVDPASLIPASTADTRPQFSLTLLTSTNAGPGDTWIYRITASDAEQPVDTLRFSTVVTGGTGEPPVANVIASGSDRLLVVRTSYRSSGSFRISLAASDASGNTETRTVSIGLSSSGGGRILFDSLFHRVPGGVLATIPFEVESGNGVQPTLSASIDPSPGPGVRLWLQRLDLGQLVGRARWRMTFLAPDTGRTPTNGLFRVTLRSAQQGPIAPVELTLRVEPGPVSVVPLEGTSWGPVEPFSLGGGGRFSVLLSGDNARRVSLVSGLEPVSNRIASLQGPIRIADWLGEGGLSVVNAVGTETLRRLAEEGPGEPVAMGDAALVLPGSPGFLDLDADGDTDTVGVPTGSGSVALSTGSHLLDTPRWLSTQGVSVGVAAAGHDRRSAARWATVHRGDPSHFQVWELQAGVAVRVGGEVLEGNLTSVHQAGWCDLDGDGLLDLWISGQRSSPSSLNVVEVFRRLDVNAGRYQRVQTLTGVRALQADWADLDGDDRPEAVLAADPVGHLPGELQRWEADATGRLVLQGSLNLSTGSTRLLLASADFDGDGRPDLLRVGGDAGRVAFLLNRFGEPSAPPPAPGSVEARFEAGRLVVTWTGSDRPGVTGNLRIGTTPGGSEIVSALASASGGRKVFRPGNAGLVKRFVLDPARVRGRRLHVAVQELNAAFVGGPFATEVEVELPAENVPPTFGTTAGIEIRAGQTGTVPLGIGDDRSAPQNLRLVPVLEEPTTSPLRFPETLRSPHLADTNGQVSLPVAAWADRVGQAWLRFTVTDDAGLVSTGRISVLVLPTNTPPFLAAPMEVASASASAAFDVWIGDREEGPETLTLRAAWAEPADGTRGVVTVTGTGAARRVAIEGSGGDRPEGLLVVTVSDSGGSTQSMNVRLRTAPGPGVTVWQMSEGFPARWNAHAGGLENLRLRSRAEPGKRYRLEASEDLTNWLPLRESLAEGPFLETGIPVGPGTPPARFHRLVPVE
jgi:hypothetical protein